MTLYSLKVNVLVIHYLLHSSLTIKQFFWYTSSARSKSYKNKRFKIMKKCKREISYKLCSGMQFKFTYYSCEAICFILIFHLFISFPRDWALDVDGSLQITLHGTWQNFSSFSYIPTSTLLSSLEREKRGDHSL